MTACLPLARAVDIERYGGKAASLALALAAGLRVPDGVALSHEAVDSVARGEAEILARLGELLDDLSATPTGPADRGLLAVRSSAVAEDSAGSSFAGVHDSVLGVRGVADVARAIEAVWASARSPGARAYRERMGIASPPRIAVVVQRLIDPDTAGVLFTRCPMTGADQRVIEAAWGLGEVVVAGLVSPDCYRLDSAGAVLEEVAGDKPIARRLGTTFISDVPVPVADVTRLCLDRDQLRALHLLAARCDDVYGSRLHDIEWAFANGELYLLQRRPITARPG